MTTVQDISADLEQDHEPYPLHISRANWQLKQLQVCKEGLKENQLLMLMDFSENDLSRFQNEATNAYFEQHQVTVHPFMCNFLDKQKDENNNMEDTFQTCKTLNSCD